MSYLEHYQLNGKTALVTGSGQGIGAACAQALAQAGAHVHCSDRDPMRASALAQSLLDAGQSASAHTLDVTDTAGLNTLAAQLPPLDILVCNAGIASHTPAQDMSDEEWQRVIDINLTGVFKTCRAFGRAMIAAQRGSIINIGSMSGQIVNRPQPQCHYNASKAGVHHLTRSLAVEWAQYGVRVNAVAPTYIATPLLDKLRDQPDLIAQWLDDTPMRRLGTPAEIAATVLFLASEAASLITGSIINADGGYTAL